MYSFTEQFKNEQPGAVMELWNGKAMHWGEEFERRDIDEVQESLRSALYCAELVNLYMFHGGTTFGFMNGSLDFGEKFSVQMTSYDVDTPLDEYGRRTQKYYAEQEVISEALGKKIINTATDTILYSYEDARFCGECSLKESGIPIDSFNSAAPKPMEFFNQGYGYIIYEAEFFAGKIGATVHFPEIHDIAHIYIDGKYAKTLERYSAEKTIELTGGEHRMAILVENLGRVNHGVKPKDYKGIVGSIVLRDKLYGISNILSGFKVYTLPIETLPESFIGMAIENQPAFYKYDFIAELPQDTVMHLNGFTAGLHLSTESILEDTGI